MRNMRWLVFVGLCATMMLSSCSCGCGGSKKKKTSKGEIHIVLNTLSGQQVSPGAQDVPVLWFDVQSNTSAFIVVNSITFKASGTGHDGNDISNVELWYDANGNGQADVGTDTVLGSGTYSGDDGTVTIAANRQISPGVTEQWLVTYDFNASASGTFFCEIVDTTTDVVATKGGNPTTVTGGNIKGPQIEIAIGDLTVAVGPNPPANATFPPGQSDVAILQFSLTAGSSDVTVVSITFKASGTGDDAADVSAAKLYHDVNGNGQYDSGTDTQLGANQTYTVDDGTITFTTNRDITAGQTEDWLLCYDFTATANGTFTASIEDVTTDVVAQIGGTPITPQGTSPITGATITIQPGDLTVSPGPNMPASRTAFPGATDEPILQVTLTAGASTDATVQTITFTASGSGDDANHVDAVRLYLDANEDGQVDAGDTQIDVDQVYTVDDGTVTFTANRTITAGNHETWLLTYDFNASATGSFMASILDIQTDVVAQDGLGNPITPSGTNPLDGATITMDTAFPTVMAAALEDGDGDGVGDAGENIIVTFDSDVTVNVAAPAGVFDLPVSGDDFGTGATLAAGPSSNQVTITLGTGCVITGQGVFDVANLNPGDPSGIDISATMPADAIEDSLGRDARPTQAVDIRVPFIPGPGVVATGPELNALDPAGQQSGEVVVQYITAYTDDTTSLTLTVEYYDGSAWNAATAAATSDPLTFTTTLDGTLRVFVWDSYADMPNAGESTDYDSVPLRFTLTDGTDTVDDLAVVKLDNKPQAVCCPNQVVNVGDLAYLDATDSFDPAGAALSYSFTMTNQPAGSTASLTVISSTASFVPDVEGDYTIDVSVTAGARTSDTVTLTVKAVTPSFYKGALTLGTLGGAVGSDVSPQELGLDPSQNIGYYSCQFNMMAFIDLSSTPVPALTTPAYDGFYNVSGQPIWIGDLYVNRSSNVCVSAWDDRGQAAQALTFLISWDTTAGAGSYKAGSGVQWTGSGLVTTGVCSFVRDWPGSAGTLTNDVGYIGTNGLLIEMGHDDPGNGNAAKLLSYSNQVSFLGGRVSLETSDHGNGLNAWVTCPGNPQEGVLIFNIDTVGDGSTGGLFDITALTWAGGWNASYRATDVVVDDTNGYAWVSYTQTAANGGVCAISLATQQVVFDYQLPVGTGDAAPFRIRPVASQGLIFLTDNSGGRLYIVGIDDFSNPSLGILQFQMDLSGAWDAEYDDPRDRLLVTGSSTSQIYALQGPWDFDTKVADGSAAQPLGDFGVAVDPTTGDICVAYEQEDTAVYFTRSTDGGLTWSAAVQVTQGVVTTIEHPSIAVDSQGEIIVVYQSDGGLPADGVYICRSSDGGATWSTPARVEPKNGQATDIRKWPSVTVDDADNIIITYVFDDGAGTTEVACVKSVGHQTWLYWGADENTVSNGAANPEYPEAVVAWESGLPLGRVHVAWTDDRSGAKDVYKNDAENRDFTPAFGASDTAVDHAAAGANSAAVRVGLDDDNVRYVWEDDRNATPDFDVYFGDGTNDTEIDAATGTTRRTPHAAYVPAGSSYVFVVYLVDGQQVYLSTSDDDGQTWSSPAPVAISSTALRLPQILTNHSGSRMIFWLQDDGTGDIDLFFTRWK